MTEPKQSPVKTSNVYIQDVFVSENELNWPVTKRKQTDLLQNKNQSQIKSIKTNICKCQHQLEQEKKLKN